MKLPFGRMVRFGISTFGIALFAILVLVPGSKQIEGAQASPGKATFNSKCAVCHGADGSGNTATGKNLKLRDLRSADVQKMSDADLTNLISKGKGKMPGYQTILGSEKIGQVVAYIRELAHAK
jgi:mono/diheme cytochrome c family protein